MIGPIADSLSLALGALVGIKLGSRISDNIKEALPMVFGVITIGIGVSLSTQASHFPVIVLSLIIGTLIGEFLYLEKHLEKIITAFIERLSSKHKESIDKM